MTLHSFQFGERFVSNSLGHLQRYGVNLTIGYDFAEYRDVLKAARPDHELGAPFDPNIHDLNKHNAFWMIGTNRDGDIMHTQAIRMLDLAGQCVSDYFLKRFSEFPPSGVDIDLNRSRYRAGPGAMRMSGNVAYHGEFWMGGAPGEYRGTGISSVLSRYGFWEAMQHYDPDHIVAFMAQAVAFKGLAERTGWMHTEPGALRWFPEGRDTPIEGFMAYLHREDLHYLLDIPLSDVIRKAA